MKQKKIYLKYYKSVNWARCTHQICCRDVGLLERDLKYMYQHILRCMLKFFPRENLSKRQLRPSLFDDQRYRELKVNEFTVKLLEINKWSEVFFNPVTAVNRAISSLFSLLETRTTRLETRFSILETRSSILDPRSSILDPRSSMLEYRASRIEFRVTVNLHLTGTVSSETGGNRQLCNPSKREKR